MDHDRRVLDEKNNHFVWEVILKEYELMHP